jgi:hypothetical protein
MYPTRPKKHREALNTAFRQSHSGEPKHMLSQHKPNNDKGKPLAQGALMHDIPSRYTEKRMGKTY